MSSRPGPHTGNDGGSGPGYVNIVDHTGPAWPVYAAALTWDRADRLDVDYRGDTCGGRAHCVGIDAYDVDFSCPERNGRTVLIWNGNTGHISEETHVRLNRNCVNNHSYRELRVITCHEEGHVIGLNEEFEERLKDETCMTTGTALAFTEETPRAHDFDILDRRLHGHDD